MNRPELKSTQFTLLVIDANTGIVLNTDFQFFLNDGKDVYFVFDDWQLMKDFINRINQRYNTYEYAIYNSEYTLIEYR
ncbi:hypothetical protein [Chitinophaga sp. CF418]|uniref:hypothetical protein n=1 Tax=Chitinophaga sp. CF418 TaxID=1855287 RepID=UPI00091FB212|nr:hypothetical protein [Chitinophaga sp. CF418]SHN07555.1 hypothetical protein SAMN05216311_10534 [Chitinophaga sp. CF418]